MFVDNGLMIALSGACQYTVWGRVGPLLISLSSNVSSIPSLRNNLDENIGCTWVLHFLPSYVLLRERYSNSDHGFQGRVFELDSFAIQLPLQTIIYCIYNSSMGRILNLADQYKGLCGNVQQQHRPSQTLTDHHQLAATKHSVLLWS